MHRNPFSDTEIDARVRRLQEIIPEKGLDAAVFSSPENVFYFTGLDYWGYFAPHMLVVPARGTPVLVARAMERIAVGNMVRTADFRGHSDSETVADETARVLAALGLWGKAVGLEQWSAGLSAGLAGALQNQISAEWRDITGLADEMRQIKSPAEQALLREAALVTNAATRAAIEAIRDGAEENEVAAQCMAAMTRAGGEPPGFGPFIRPGVRMGEEHSTWGHGRYQRGEVVFLEIAGCVGRYNAPNGRFVHIGEMPKENRAMADLTEQGFRAVLENLKPGAKAREVYDAWQAVINEAGMSHYRRHHCGYMVGIAFPPTWTGGNKVVGLRADSDLEIKAGMSFHIMSWLTGTGRGDFFLSDCVLLGESGAEALTTTPHIQTR